MNCVLCWPLLALVLLALVSGQSNSYRPVPDLPLGSTNQRIDYSNPSFGFERRGLSLKRTDKRRPEYSEIRRDFDYQQNVAKVQHKPFTTSLPPNDGTTVYTVRITPSLSRLETYLPKTTPTPKPEVTGTPNVSRLQKYTPKPTPPLNGDESRLVYQLTPSTSAAPKFVTSGPTPVTSLPYRPPYVPQSHRLGPTTPPLNYLTPQHETKLVSSIGGPTVASYQPTSTTEQQQQSPATIYQQRMKEYFKKNPEKFRQYYQQLQAYHSAKKLKAQQENRRIQEASAESQSLDSKSAEEPKKFAIKAPKLTVTTPKSQEVTATLKKDHFDDQKLTFMESKGNIMHCLVYFRCFNRP